MGVTMKIRNSRNVSIVLFALLFFYALPSLAKKASAEQVKATKSNYPDTIIILDASGSMWGQISGKPKIQIAKEVMNDLIDKLPPEMRVGLMAYGHRRKGDCNDIEMLTPIGKVNPSIMKAKIKAITPKGKTPLSAAVKQAAEKLHYASKRATVVLVSDGLETCGGNPCDLAERLAMNGVDFTVHVIGFDLSKEEQLRLRCLADKTGGLFLAADDADALRTALFTTMKKVQEPPPPGKENLGKAMSKGPATVPVGAAFQVAWEGPDSHRDFISISKKGSEDLRYVNYAYTESGNPVRLIAPGDKGAYELRYVHAHSRQVIGRADIKITPVTAEVEAPPSANVATKIEVSWEGPAYKSDYVSIARPEQRPGSYITYTYVSRGNPLKVQVPSEPGTYEVRYIMGRGDKLLAKTTFTAKAVTAQVKAPDSANVASKIQVNWEGPANKSDYVSIARPDQKPSRYVTYTYVSRGNPLKVQVPSEPGTYEIRYILGRGDKLLAKTTFTAKAVTAQVQAPDSANVASKIQVNWEGPGYSGDYISIARPDQKPSRYVTYSYASSGNPLTVKTPPKPGTYEVRYIMGRGNKLLAKRAIVIR
jgi:Ca-activated chloride channel homolog